MKKTVLALSAAAVCVASAAPVLAEGQNPMTAPVQISMQGDDSFMRQVLRKRCPGCSLLMRLLLLFWADDAREDFA